MVMRYSRSVPAEVGDGTVEKKVKYINFKCDTLSSNASIPNNHNHILYLMVSNVSFRACEPACARALVALSTLEIDTAYLFANAYSTCILYVYAKIII